MRRAKTPRGASSIAGSRTPNTVWAVLRLPLLAEATQIGSDARASGRLAHQLL